MGGDSLGNDNAAQLYFVESHCGTFSFSSLVIDEELTCVVCTELAKQHAF